MDEATGRNTGVDALAAACANGHVACVQLLLKQDIDMCCRILVPCWMMSASDMSVL